jgi:hypothetical protein
VLKGHGFDPKPGLERCDRLHVNEDNAGLHDGDGSGSENNFTPTREDYIIFSKSLV